MISLPKDKLIYLASPYTHSDPEKVVERFEAVCKAAAELMKSDHLVFSPIAHTHPLVKYGLPGHWDFWENYDRLCLKACGVVAVLMLDGWEDSKGVQAEIKIAHEYGLPVVYLDPENISEPMVLASLKWQTTTKKD